jgi:ATP adenylyltransferase
MKVIWAPWRMAYIKHARKPARCIFCSKARERRDAANLLLHRGRHGFVMMNLFPYNSGHLLVAPYAHVNSPESLSADAALDLIRLTNLSLRALRAAIRPEGFNVGMNLGRVSGAGLDAHVHLHIVPRWNGDTNFMPLFSETRVIPEHLRETYRKLRARFRQMTAQGRDDWSGAATRSPARLSGSGSRRPPKRHSDPRS